MKIERKHAVLFLAIAAWKEFDGRIDLLLTDMVMPGGLSGSDVADRFSDWDAYGDPIRDCVHTLGFNH